MPDEATQARQRELEKRHRDLTKPEVPLGSTPESLRSIRGMENITDEMLAERANFSLGTVKASAGFRQVQKNDEQYTVLDFTKMTPDELRGLANAAKDELKQRKEK